MSKSYDPNFNRRVLVRATTIAKYSYLYIFAWKIPYHNIIIPYFLLFQRHSFEYVVCRWETKNNVNLDVVSLLMSISTRLKPDCWQPIFFVRPHSLIARYWTDDTLKLLKLTLNVRQIRYTETGKILETKRLQTRFRMLSRNQKQFLCNMGHNSFKFPFVSSF